MAHGLSIAGYHHKQTNPKTKPRLKLANPKMYKMLKIIFFILTEYCVNIITIIVIPSKYCLQTLHQAVHTAATCRDQGKEGGPGDHQVGHGQVQGAGRGQVQV